MLFNSLPFLIFFPIVLLLYWRFFYTKIQARAIFLIAASYIFYGWWDYRFLGLIILSTLIDFVVGRKIYAASSSRTKKTWLMVSLCSNLGILGFFKYFNFFTDSWVSLFQQFDITWNPVFVQILLPVGISFYTFQTLSYTIDIYRNKIEPAKNVWLFGAYVAFFPQLVAGPIERAEHLLPQFSKINTLKRWEIKIALKQILWGFFKKIVIADTSAQYVNLIFDNPGEQSSFTLCAGAILFAFQIYGDFSGYSDIAIGTARLLGFKLMDNFKYPYFSRSIPEFWRRWHISLSTWFRDYLYIPLGGSRVSYPKRIRNIFVIFMVSGLWHGANWTFVVWGFIHALLFLPSLLTKTSLFKASIFQKPAQESKWVSFIAMLTTFSIVCLAWIFFRAENLNQATSYLQALFSNGRLENSINIPVYLWFVLVLFIVTEFISRKQRYPIFFSSKVALGRSVAYSVVILFILASLYWIDEQTFIYFQF